MTDNAIIKMVMGSLVVLLGAVVMAALTEKQQVTPPELTPECFIEGVVVWQTMF